MERHRLVNSKDIQFIKISRPFSSFDYIENNFGNLDSLRRLFSLARSFNALTLIVETIEPLGLIESENNALSKMFSKYSSKGVVRLSFWSVEIKDTETLSKVSNSKLIGYGIVKHDSAPSQNLDRWHIFESIVKKYNHRHNCVPCPRSYSLSVGSKIFCIEGLLYCQQNTLNKACAHVAIRSLLSRLLPQGDVSYYELNNIAKNNADSGWKPSQGLNTLQIRDILKHFNIGFRDIDYNQNPNLVKRMPFQKYAYAGIESGGGALVGFNLAGPGLSDTRSHIIPFYGHTFNQDTWAPDADVAYFKIGSSVGYIPSESWTSSFIGHDDNFGSNFCIPRLYIKAEQVKYVVELLQPNVKYSGVEAEMLAIDFLYSVIPYISSKQNLWLKRLKEWEEQRKIVLRAQHITKTNYIEHLKTAEDWDGNLENKELCDLLITMLPETLWMVELSTPQLFPANERKLGEIILDASKNIGNTSTKIPFDVFILARFPASYFFGRSIDKTGQPSFAAVPSCFVSHTPLYRT